MQQSFPKSRILNVESKLKGTHNMNTNFFVRVLISAIAITITAAILPGITIIDNSIVTVLIIGLIFGIVNAFVRPFVLLMTCPAVVLSLGFFILIVNGFMLQLVAWFAGDRLMVDGFGWAFLGGIIMSVISMILESLTQSRETRNDKIVIERNIPR